MRLPLLIASLLAVSLVASTGFGETRAEQLFKGGRKAMKANDWTAALPLLSESYELEAAPGTLLNLAECESHLGKLLASFDHFKKVEVALPAGDKRREVAAERARVLSERVPKVVVRLAPAAPAGTEVRHGTARVEVGATLRVDPGTVKLEVSAPGRRARSFSVELGEGEQQVLTVEPGEVEGATGPSGVVPTGPASGSSGRGQPEVVPIASTGSTRRTIGFVVGGVGVASLGVGALTGVLALSKASVVKNHCDPSLACDPQGVEAGSSGQTLALVSTITVIGGLLAVGAGTYLVLSSRRTAPRTAVLPFVAPGAGGLALQGAF